MIDGYVVIAARENSIPYIGVDMSWSGNLWPELEIWNEQNPSLNIDISAIYENRFFESLSKEIVEYYKWLLKTAITKSYLLYFTDDLASNSSIVEEQNMHPEFIGYDCAYIEENYHGGFSALLNEDNVELNALKSQVNTFGLLDNPQSAIEFIALRDGLLEQQADGLETAFPELQMKPVKVFLLKL